MRTITKLIWRPKLIVRTNYRVFSLEKEFSQMPNEKMKTDIVSLSTTQMNQLLTIAHYSSSNAMLEQNKIEQAYHGLQHSLSQARINYPQSINLHMFLLNRLSILQKIKGMNPQLVQTLEEIFFMCLSLKGHHSLDTFKHLHNYLISICLFAPWKGQPVTQFLSESNYSTLLKKSFLMRKLIEVIASEDLDKGIFALKHWHPNDGQLQMKLNNLNWLKILKIQKGSDPSSKQEVFAIVSQLIQALQKSQKNTQNLSQDHEGVVNLFNQYVNEGSSISQFKLLKQMNQIRVKNYNSLIITMNLAHIFYYMNQTVACRIFLTITIESALLINEIERVGFALILMAKLQYLNRGQWQSALLNILSLKDEYNEGVIKECLRAYSFLLYKSERFLQAEEYYAQSEQIQRGSVLEGLILPEFDFSF